MGTTYRDNICCCFQQKWKVVCEDFPDRFEKIACFCNKGLA